MRRYRGKELRVNPFDGVFGTSWYAVVTDPATKKSAEGGLHRIKLFAWLDAYRIAR